jgi:hypothetical protein
VRPIRCYGGWFFIRNSLDQSGAQDEPYHGEAGSLKLGPIDFSGGLLLEVGSGWGG